MTTPDHSSYPTPSPSAQRAQHAPPELSLIKAYVLCALGGVFGLHRFYLRRPLSATLYLLSFGFLTLGVFVDLLLLPWLTRKSRAKLKERHERHERHERRERHERHEQRTMSQAAQTTRSSEPAQPSPAQVYTADELNPFSSAIPTLSTMRKLSLGFWMLMLPYLAIVIFGDWVFVLVFALLMITVTSERLVVWLAETPPFSWFFSEFYQGYQELEAHYQSRRPPRFSVPVLSTMLRFLTANGRAEMRLFSNLASFGVAFIAFEWISLIHEYLTEYYPELGIGSFITVKFTMFILSVMILISSVVPVTRTLVYAKLSNQTTTVYKISAVVLVIFVALIAQSDLRYNNEDHMRYEERFTQSEPFRALVDQTIRELTEAQVKPWAPSGEHPHAKLAASLGLSEQLTRDLTRASGAPFDSGVERESLVGVNTNTKHLVTLARAGITLYPEESLRWHLSIRSALIERGLSTSEASVFKVLLFSRDAQLSVGFPYPLSDHLSSGASLIADRLRPTLYEGDSLATLNLKLQESLGLTEDEAIERVARYFSTEQLNQRAQGLFLLIYDGFDDAEIKRPRLFKLRVGSGVTQTLSWRDLERVASPLEAEAMWTLVLSGL